MFGCCNTLFGSCCRCNRCCMGGTPIPPMPVPPFFPPVTPPAAPPTLRGMQLSLTTQSAQTIAQNAVVPFDTVDYNDTVGVTCAPSGGTTTINGTGTYLVNWWVAIENTQTQEVSFALMLNGSQVQASYSDIGGGQIFGTAIVPVTAIGSSLTLVNNSECTITYADTKEQAGMTITQVK